MGEERTEVRSQSESVGEEALEGAMWVMVSMGVPRSWRRVEVLRGLVGEGEGAAGVEVGVPEEAVALVVVLVDVNGGVGCGAPVDDPVGRGTLVSGFTLGQAE